MEHKRINMQNATNILVNGHVYAVTVVPALWFFTPFEAIAGFKQDP